MKYLGYIKLYRKIQDNPLYKEKRRFSRSEAWIDLLLMATHKSTEIIVDFKRVPIKRGQVFTSQLGLSKKWNWGIASVNRFLKFLKTGNQISYKGERKYTIISILNWNKYQGEAETTTETTTESIAETRRKADGKQTETYKNVKNVKNDKNDTQSVWIKQFGNGITLLIRRYGEKQVSEAIKIYEARKDGIRDPFAYITTLCRAGASFDDTKEAEGEKYLKFLEAKTKSFNQIAKKFPK